MYVLSLKPIHFDFTTKSVMPRKEKGIPSSLLGRGVKKESRLTDGKVFGAMPCRDPARTKPKVFGLVRKCGKFCLLSLSSLRN